MKKFLTFVLLPITFVFALLFTVGAASSAPHTVNADEDHYIRFFDKGECFFDLEDAGDGTHTLEDYVLMFKDYPDNYKTIDWVNLKGWSFSEGGERVNLKNYKDDGTYDVYAVYTETPYAEGEDPNEQQNQNDNKGSSDETSTTPEEDQFVKSLKDFAEKIGLGGLSTAWQIGIILVAAVVIIKFVFDRR